MREFRQWSEYEQLEPFGDYWGLRQTSILLASVMNYMRRKGSKPHAPDDFMPGWRARPEQTASEQRSVFAAFVAAHNRRIKADG